jgi:HK97 family phage major capsid protein
MKLTEASLVTLLAQAIETKLAELSKAAPMRALIADAGGEEKAQSYIKQATFYGKLLGFVARAGGEIKAITDDIMYTGAATQGGNINAPPEIFAEIQRIEKDASVVVPLCTTINQTRDVIYVPTDTSDLAITYAEEAGKKGVTKLALTKATLTLKKPAAIVVISDELLDGSVVAIVDYINTRIGEDFAEDYDYRVIGPAAATPYDNISNVSGTAHVDLTGTAGIPTYKDVVDVTSSIKARAMRGAGWFMHRSVLGEFRKVVGSDGHPLFQSALAGQPTSLAGFPIYLSDTMITWSAASSTDVVALFGNMKYWFRGVKRELNISQSRDAAITLDGTLTSLFENNMMAIRAEARRSGALVLPSAFCLVKKGS